MSSATPATEATPPRESGGGDGGGGRAGRERRHRRRSGSIAAKVKWEDAVQSAKRSSMERALMARSNRMEEVCPPQIKPAWDEVARETSQRRAVESRKLSTARAAEILRPEDGRSYVRLLQDELRRRQAEAEAAGRVESSRRASLVQQELRGCNVREQIDKLEDLLRRVGLLDESRARQMWKVCVAAQGNPTAFFDQDDASDGSDEEDETVELPSREARMDDQAVEPAPRNGDGAAWFFEAELARLLDLPDDELLDVVLDKDFRQKKLLAQVFSPPRHLVDLRTRGYV